MSTLDLSAPASEPPPGEVQQLVNPPNLNGVVIAVYTVSILIATIFVGMRTYAKFYFLRPPRIEDWFMLPTFGLYLAHSVFWLRMCNFTGHFVHNWNFTIGGTTPFYENAFYGTILYEVVMLIIKPLILLEWVHMFASAGPKNLFYWSCYIIGVINILLYTASILVDAASCMPREFWWDKTIEGHCADTKLLPIITAVGNTIIDVIILVLPQRVIWKLNISTKKKIGVSIVFLVGILSVASALVRTVLSFGYASSPDVTYEFSKVGIFGIVEMTSAIIVFAAPTVPKPSHHLFKQAGSQISRLITSRDSGTDVYRSFDAESQRGNGSLVLRKLRSSKSKSSMQNSAKLTTSQDDINVPPLPN